MGHIATVLVSLFKKMMKVIYDKLTKSYIQISQYIKPRYKKKPVYFWTLYSKILDVSTTLQKKND